MNKNITLSASLMCCDWVNLRHEIDTLINNNITNFHIDLIDGKFAEDFCMGTSIIDNIKEYINENHKDKNIVFDYHFMVNEPSNLFDLFSSDDNSIITIHLEGSENILKDLHKLQKLNVKIGLAIKPTTPVIELKPLLHLVDLVLIVSVNPGFKGQTLFPSTFERISQIQELKTSTGTNFKIGVDGNVSFENIPIMLNAGANFLVLGSSSIFNKNKKKEDLFLTLKQSLNWNVADEI